MSFKGSSGSGTQRVENITIPDEVMPYLLDILDRGEGQSVLDYQTYGAPRLAEFTPEEQTAQQAYADLYRADLPSQFAEGRGLFSGAGDVAGRLAEYGASGGGAGVGAIGAVNYDPASRDAEYAAGQMANNYAANQRNSGYQASGIDSLFRGERGTNAYVAGQRDVEFDPGTLNNREMIESYMNPYTQLVVDRAKDEARRQSEVSGAAIGGEAAGSGSLGGYREAIMQSERLRNLEDEMTGIQVEGMSQAYNNAVSLMEADRNANVQLETFRQNQFQLNESSRQAMQEYSMRQQDLNNTAMQAEETLRQNAFQLTDQSQQALEQFNQAQFAANEAARQVQQQLESDAFSNNEQAKQALEKFKQSQFQMNEAGKQFKAQLADNAANRSSQASIAAANRALQANIAGMEGMLASGKSLYDSGLTDESAYLNRVNLMNQSGMAQRALEQAGIDIGYQDFLNQQAYPIEVLNQLAALVYGAPFQPGSVTTMYNSGPSTAELLTSLGLLGAGIYNQGR